MSLGKYTECNLSAGVAKIDLAKLTNQVEIHYYSLLDKMRKKMSDVQYDNQKPESRTNALSCMSSTGSDEVMRLANQIAETTELLHTLYETSERKIEIV